MDAIFYNNIFGHKKKQLLMFQNLIIPLLIANVDWKLGLVLCYGEEGLKLSQNYDFKFYLHYKLNCCHEGSLWECSQYTQKIWTHLLTQLRIVLSYRVLPFVQKIPLLLF